MSEILNTKYGTYDLNDRKSAYIYFCQNFGFHSRDMSLIEQYFITEYEELEKEIEKLQKQNEKLREAVEFVIKNYGTGWDYYFKCKRTLSEIEDEK